jgi:3-phosphoshikimate 1-carboxyvinyltransferase
MSRAAIPAQRIERSILVVRGHKVLLDAELAALGGVTVRINDPQCVNKTFPEYFEVLSKIAR